MSAIDDDMRRVYAIAKEHEDRFLLPTRGTASVDYHACQRLIFGGYAREISQWSDMRPGITLTGKPLPGQATPSPSHPSDENQR